MSALSAKATPVRGGVSRAARKVPGGVGVTGRGGESGGGAGVSVCVLGGVGSVLVLWVEAEGKEEEEKPTLVLELGLGWGRLLAGEEVPCGRGAVGLGCAWGERKTLGPVAGALWKELVVGEGAGGLSVLARRLPFAF